MNETDSHNGFTPISSIFWKVLGGVSIGLLLSALLLPAWIPGLLFSISGDEPKVFWLLSRATAIIAYILLWFSLAFGLALTAKIAKYFPGTFTANDMHQFISITGLIFSLLHGLLLIGDKYLQLSVLQVLIPFRVIGYKPGWVGVGQIGMWIWVVLILSFYLRKRIGYKTWRAIHFSGYLVFGGSMLHGIQAGSDSGTLAMQMLYWVSGASILFLTFYRILSVVDAKKAARPVAVTPQPRIEPYV